MSGRKPVPASLKKQLGKYLMAAKSFKRISPITALYCKLWALDIAKSQVNAETRGYILQLADDCVAEKEALKPSAEDAKKAIRASGANIFVNIYNNEASMDGKTAAKGYRDCFVCFEILKHPNLKESMADGELEIYAQNAKFLAFKSAAALNPNIVKDEMPDPPPALQKLLGIQDDNDANDIDDDALLKELDGMEVDSAADPWASYNSTQPSNPVDEKQDDPMPDAGPSAFNPDSNADTAMGGMGGMNPYYGNMGNPYYGGPGGGADANATMPSADNANNNGMDAEESLPSPPGANAAPATRKQPSYADLTKQLPAAKYDESSDNMGGASGASATSGGAGGTGSGNVTDLSSYLADSGSEKAKMWSAVKNGDKYKKECVKTLDEAIYCLMLGEPDFRGAMDITQKAVKMINLCRQSVGLQVINIPLKPPTDIPPHNAGGQTSDWFGKPIGTKKFFRLQELSFEAESRLKKGKRHVERSELPGTETFVLIQEAVSMLKPIAAIQPAWE